MEGYVYVCRCVWGARCTFLFFFAWNLSLSFLSGDPYPPALAFFLYYFSNNSFPFDYSISTFSFWNSYCLVAMSSFILQFFFLFQMNIFDIQHHANLRYVTCYFKFLMSLLSNSLCSFLALLFGCILKLLTFKALSFKIVPDMRFQYLWFFFVIITCFIACCFCNLFSPMDGI